MKTAPRGTKKSTRGGNTFSPLIPLRSEERVRSASFRRSLQCVRVWWPWPVSPVRAVWSFAQNWFDVPGGKTGNGVPFQWKSPIPLAQTIPRPPPGFNPAVQRPFAFLFSWIRYSIPPRKRPGTPVANAPVSTGSDSPQAPQRGGPCIELLLLLSS